MAGSGAEDHFMTLISDRQAAETEMVRAAVVEFLRMEQSLRAAAAHLAAAEDIRAGAEDGGAAGAGSKVGTELSELATRLALPG
jgi:hypothetical protein